MLRAVSKRGTPTRAAFSILFVFAMCGIIKVVLSMLKRSQRPKKSADSTCPAAKPSRAEPTFGIADERSAGEVPVESPTGEAAAVVTDSSSRGTAVATPKTAFVLFPWSPVVPHVTGGTPPVSTDQWQRACDHLQRPPPQQQHQTSPRGGRGNGRGRGGGQQPSVDTQHITRAVGVVMALNPDGAHRTARLGGLTRTLNELCDAPFRTHFAQSVLPWMGRLLAEAPNAFPGGLPLLTKLPEDPSATAPSLASVILTERQVATLLVMGFFSLFPLRSAVRMAQRFGGNSEDALLEMPMFNFAQILSLEQPPAMGKLRCILQYFATSSRELAIDSQQQMNNGKHIEFLRCGNGGAALDGRMREGAPHVPLTPLEYAERRPIERCDGMAQADFANEWIGGGALRYGCVQEEILFVVKPQLLVGLLLCERMAPHEAVAITGARQFSASTGYADSFAFAGAFREQQLAANEGYDVEVPPHCINMAPSTIINVRDAVVVAFDAVDFSKMGSPSAQYAPLHIRRELRKAQAALDASQWALAWHEGRGFATGGWGCGVFRGHHALKFAIQWVAASFAGCPSMVYCAFARGDELSGVRALLELFSETKPTAQEVLRGMLHFDAAVGSYGASENSFVRFFLSGEYRNY